MLLERGGDDAADELRQRTREYLSGIKEDFHQLDIVVKAFANIEDVSSTLTRRGKIRDKEKFRKFVADFNSKAAFFDFLHVGSGKERADQKIRGTFPSVDFSPYHGPLNSMCSMSENVKFYLDMPQCKHILLAFCHDGGYAPFLGQLLGGDSNTLERVTLVVGGSVAAAFQPLKLKTTSFPSVSLAPSSTNEPVRDTKKFTIEVSSQQMCKLASVLVKSSGRRMDVPLSVDESLLKSMKTLNLCHWLFLRGECRGCSRNHAHRPLTDPEFDALWLDARQGPCNRAKQSRCDDTKCIYGHGQ